MFEAIRAGVFDHRLLVKRELKDVVEQDFRGVSRIVTEDGKVRFSASRSDEGHSDVTSSLALGLEAVRQNPLAISKPTTAYPFSAFGHRVNRLG